MRIEYIDYGVGYCKQDTILLNQKLLEPQWQKLKDKVINHEEKHTRGLYDISDLEHDIDSVENAGYDFQLIRFHLEDIIQSLPHFPKTLWQYMPINPSFKIQPIPALTWITIILALITGFYILP